MVDTELLSRPATDLAVLVRAGELSARELAEAALSRIEEVNPLINAFTLVDADGALAAQLEEHRALMAAIDASPLRPPVVHLIWATDDELPRRRLRTALHAPEASIVPTAQEAFRAAIKAALLTAPPSLLERRGRGRPA